MSAERFEVPCEGGRVGFARPVFPPRGGDAHGVEIEGTCRGLSFTVATDTHGDGYGLVEFFAELAEAWNGWDNAKSWSSDDARVLLTAVHDGRRSVTLTIEHRSDVAVTVESEEPLPTSAWRAGLAVTVEPGSLDEIHAGIASLLGRDNNPHGARA